MKTIINFIKRLPLLFSREKEPYGRLSVAQIDELIELNKDELVCIGDDADYDSMGDYGKFPPMEKVVNKRKLHDK